MLLLEEVDMDIKDFKVLEVEVVVVVKDFKVLEVEVELDFKASKDL